MVQQLESSSSDQGGYTRPETLVATSPKGTAVTPAMPGSIRAALSIINIFAIIGVVGTVSLAAFRNVEIAGANTVGYFFFWPLAIAASFFRRGGNGVRVTAIILAILEGLVALGSVGANSGDTGDDGPGMHIVRFSPGPFGLIASFVIVILLCQSSAGRWFKKDSVAQR
ncbi:hypothetical protein ACIBG0_41325 [Nocardia sp. NPDC050630]|uniref:hypothetical protein n=1 Tax=Nocardia sp. NPDC050630 TaxID=3364321 RepID=UPI0037A9C361